MTRCHQYYNNYIYWLSVNSSFKQKSILSPKQKTNFKPECIVMVVLSASHHLVLLLTIQLPLVKVGPNTFPPTPRPLLQGHPVSDRPALIDVIIGKHLRELSPLSCLRLPVNSSPPGAVSPSGTAPPPFPGQLSSPPCGPISKSPPPRSLSRYYPATRRTGQSHLAFLLNRYPALATAFMNSLYEQRQLANWTLLYVSTWNRCSLPHRLKRIFERTNELFPSFLLA